MVYIISVQKTLDTKGFYLILRRSLLNGGIMKYDMKRLSSGLLFCVINTCTSHLINISLSKLKTQKSRDQNAVWW